MTEENSKNNTQIHKLKVYIYKSLLQYCPFCNERLVPAKLKNKKDKIIDLEMATCKRCNKRFATPIFYITYEKNIILQNPQQANSLIETIKSEEREKKEKEQALKAEKAAAKKAQKAERKAREEALRAEKEARLIAQRDEIKQRAIENMGPMSPHMLNALPLKMRFLDPIYQEWFPVSAFDIDGFSESWIKTNFRNSVYDSLFVIFLIRDNKGKFKCVAISPIYKDISDRENTFSIIHISGKMAQALLNSVKAKQTWFDYNNKHFDVVSAIALKEGDLVKRVGRINLRKLYSGKHENICEVETNHSFDYSNHECVYVYFRLTNTCVRYNHEIETVTAKTTNAKNGESIEVNVFHCLNCDRYFINYEALQEYITRGIFPAFNYSMVRDPSSAMKEASELMLYGYNVREGVLSTDERHSVLSWIIDSGLMTKANIIKDLEFKVRYNGNKVGNEKARMKWQDDIQFVSRYVDDNDKEMKAEFAPR